MGRRVFQTQSFRDGSQWTKRYRLICGSCGVGETLGQQSFGTQLASELVPKKFEAMGWTVGKHFSGSDDRCSACANREAEARRKKIHIVPAEEPAMTAAKPSVFDQLHGQPQQKAEPPRAMTRDERRLIWAKLEEVYLDERSGFTAGWTDERVAVDLGVPRAWISTIREENFGPDHSVEVEKALSTANELAVAIADLDRDMAALKARGQEIAKKAELIGRALKRIDGARGAA